MKIAKLPVNEIERIKALKEYSILDTLPEEDFDNITKLASEICGTGISLVSLVDSNRQWFKSRHGLPVEETPREIAFCSHAINHPTEMFIVNDSREDERFFDNPLVTDSPNVIFYAGVPLVNPKGYPLGTLCVIDDEPKELSANQVESLKSLANIVVKLLELKKANAKLEATQKDLRRKNEELEQFAYVASHDIKSPLSNIISLTDMLRDEYGDKIDDNGKGILKFLNNSAHTLKNLVDGILNHYKSDQIKITEKELLELQFELIGVISIVDPKGEFEINIPSDFVQINVNKTAFEQILINLIANAIKYNDKPKGIIDISFEEGKKFYRFSIKDNGAGIAEADQQKVFKLFTNLGKKDRFNQVGTGVGLSTVKKLVEKLGGEIILRSELGQGSEFIFTIRK